MSADYVTFSYFLPESHARCRFYVTPDIALASSWIVLSIDDLTLSFCAYPVLPDNATGGTIAVTNSVIYFLTFFMAFHYLLGTYMFL